MRVIIQTQLDDIRRNTNEILYKLYQRNHTNIPDFLSLVTTTYELVTRIRQISSQNNPIALSMLEIQQIASEFLYQNFEDEMLNVYERGLFYTFVHIAFAEIYIGQEHWELALHQTCCSYRALGSTQPFRDQDYAQIFKIQNAKKGGLVKAKKSQQARESLYRLFDARFSNTNLRSEQKSSFIGFARYIVEHPDLIRDENNNVITNNHGHHWFSDPKGVAELCSRYERSKKHL